MVGILVVALCSATFFIGRSTVQPIPPAPIKPGIPDTVFVRVEPITGQAHSKPPVYVAELEGIYIVALPDFAEVEVHIDEPYITGDIRATAYPYVENDTLKIENVLEFNIQPLPYEITIHDTIPVLQFVEADVPWIAKPATVATGVSVLWVLLIILL